MEVICTTDHFATIMDLDGKFLNKKTNDPKKYDVCIVTESTECQGETYFTLEGFDPKIAYNSKHFERIDGLQDQINSALKAKNPNIRKFGLTELEQVGYRIKNVMPETKIMIIRNPFPFNGHWLYDKFNSRC